MLQNLKNYKSKIMEKKFLVYLDILGFEKLAEEIEDNENIKTNVVRENIFKNPINEEIKKLKECGKISGVSKGSDDWILVINDSDNIFEVVSKISRIEMPVGEHAAKLTKDYGNIPLEIAIGCYEFDKWAKLDGDEVTCNDEVIDFLKTYILPIYCKTYKKENSFEIKNGDLSEKSLKEEFLNRGISLSECLLREETEGKEWILIDALNRYEIKKDENSFKVFKLITKSFVICTDSFFDELKKERVEKYFVKKDFTYTDKSREEKKYYLLNKKNLICEGKIPDFLQKIGQSKSDYSGALIDRIFVSPDEYPEIKKKLKKDRVVFMTGTAGYGKTYTAIRLLWEWYLKGYTPRWIAGGSEKEREEVGKRLANIDAELKPKHIIYFEDPFGKTKYERRDDLKERINHIINSVRNKKDVFVVITSRKDVFEEFEKECYSVEEIKEFEKELNILKPSYDYKKRKEILEKWAEEKGCEWFGDENLKKVVFDSLKNKGTLATPLSIHDFVGATVNVKDEKELRQKIDNYSREVEIAFADEIKGLYDSGRIDRVLFLSFIFVSEYSEKKFVKEEYEKLKGENFEDFENILKEEYRINVVRTIELKYGEKIVFSHPSYSNTLKHIIKHPGCRKIFCNVLKELAKKDSTAGNVALAVADNFEELPEDVRNLLFELAKKDSTAGEVVLVVLNNFEKLPEDVRNLLFELAKKDSTAGDVALAVADNFEELPEDVRNKLLFELAKKDSAVRSVVLTIADNFEKLPEDVRNLLFELAKKDSTIRSVVLTIADNFEKLPEGVRNKVLFELAKKDSTVWVVAREVVNNFEKLPEKVRNKLLLKLAKQDSAAGDVAWAVADNFEKLPVEIQNLLDDLQKELISKIEELSESKEEWNRKQAVDLILNTKSKLKKEFAIKILTKLSKDENKDVREKALSALKEFQ